MQPASVLQLNRLALAADRPIDILGFGENSLDEVWLLDHAMSIGGKQRVTRRLQLGGGQIATAMVAAARLELNVAYAGAIGRDAAGETVHAELLAERVDVSALHAVPEGRTRSALIVVDPSGERTIFEDVDGRTQLSHATLPVSELSRAKILHVDATDIAHSITLAKAARAAGTLVSLDVDRTAPGLDELLLCADICISSATFPTAHTGEPTLERALAKLATLGPKLVGATLADKGAALLDAGHLVLSPAFSQRVVDTTACGDTFHAAFLHALIGGHNAVSCLRFANAAAALKCRDIGRRGCPSLAEVHALLAS